MGTLQQHRIAPSVGQGRPGGIGPRSAHRPVGDFLRAGPASASRCGCLLFAWRAARPQPTPVVVGSKRFTESYVLGEIVAQTLAGAGVAGASTSQGLGNTGILEQALASGAVDLYPEYTGTIVRELLKRDGNPVARRAQPLAGAARAEGGGAVRLQQHLRAGDDSTAQARRSASRRISDLARPRGGRARARPLARVPAARRRLAGAAKAPTALPRREPERPRPRPGLRRDRRGPGRRDRRLFDRRQDRPARAARARATTAASSRSTTRCC